MKISKLFHYLYAVIMFLPLLVIPIFAINIINRSPTPISIQYQVDDVKNFYQNVKNGKPVSLEYWSSDTGNLNYDNYDNSLADYSGDDIYVNNLVDFTFNTEDSIYYSFDLSVSLSYQLQPSFDVNLFSVGDDAIIFSDTPVYTFEDNVYNHISGLFSPFEDGVYDAHFQLYIETYSEFYLKNIQLFNLTTIFGSGNEPTKEVFESYLKKDYYDFGDNDVVIGKTYVTYDDTDIGSQYVYSLYHVVDKYFNFNNILPFQGVYNWFLANVFTGVSPVGFTLLYNLMMYWLFVSLIWLMFDVFMYVPLVIHNLIDKARIE